jgi:predicted lipoprotein with Yx(FWY)xxD motif
MKITTLISLFVALLVIVGGFYFWSSTVTPKPAPVVETPQPQGPVTVNEGEHCGGNMMNAPICATGLHCAKDPASNLPMGDVGGLCVKDNPALYIEGNLLLGTDATTTLGKYLIAYNGMTLYTFTKDKVGTTTCYGQCAENWPPYIVEATSSLTNIQEGVTGKVGSVTRADGTLQVTYKGWPLYFFGNDKVSGDTKGQAINKVWYVVKP